MSSSKVWPQWRPWRLVLWKGLDQGELWGQCGHNPLSCQEGLWQRKETELQIRLCTAKAAGSGSRWRGERKRGMTFQQRPSVVLSLVCQLNWAGWLLKANCPSPYSGLSINSNSTYKWRRELVLEGERAENVLLRNSQDTDWPPSCAPRGPKPPYSGWILPSCGFSMLTCSEETERMGMGPSKPPLRATPTDAPGMGPGCPNSLADELGAKMNSNYLKISSLYHFNPLGSIFNDSGFYLCVYCFHLVFLWPECLLFQEKHLCGGSLSLVARTKKLSSFLPHLFKASLLAFSKSWNFLGLSALLSVAPKLAVFPQCKTCLSTKSQDVKSLSLPSASCRPSTLPLSD